MRTYFFKPGNQPAQSFNVSVEGLMIADGINNCTLQTQAAYHAKLLACLFGVPVKFWPKDKPQNTVVVEYEPDEQVAIAV